MERWSTEVGGTCWGALGCPPVARFPYHPAKTSKLELFLDLADHGADLRMATA